MYFVIALSWYYCTAPFSIINWCPVNICDDVMMMMMMTTVTMIDDD